MKPIQQLLRQPLRLIAILLLLSIGCSFFTISVGVTITARDTAQTIDKGFTTVAFPTTRTELKEYQTDDGFTFTAEASVITAEMEDWIAQLPQTTSAVQGIYHQNYISAYSEQLQSWTSASGDAQYQWSANASYNGAVFLVELTRIGEMQPDELTGSVSVNLSSKVLEVLALHPDYAQRSKLEIYLTMESEQAIRDANLEIGGTYLVYSDNYVDSDLEQRTQLATALHCSAGEIDWDNLVYTGTQAFYVTDDHEIGPLEDMENRVDAGSVVVQNKGAGYLEDIYFPQLDGTVSTLTARELCDNPTIAPVSGDVEAYLSSEAGSGWMRMIRQCRIQYGCVPVLGTDLLESVYPFLNGDCYLVQGRTFEEADYAGKRVCIIPETVALASGLSVGDSIALSCYWGADPYGELTDGVGPSAQHYNELVGFSGENTEYTIVGIYRQMNAWDESAYSINPNTVFVPSRTLPAVSYTSNKGMFYALLLENGSIDEVKAVLTEKGFPDDILLFFDGGYSQIADGLQGFRANIWVQFFVALAVYLAVGIAYFVFFVEKQRHCIGLMLSQGAGKGKARAFGWSISMVPIGLGVAIGTLCGSLGMNRMLQKLFSSSFEDAEALLGAAGMDSAMADPVRVLPVSIALQLALCAIAVAVWVECHIRKKPLALIKNMK